MLRSLRRSTAVALALAFVLSGLAWASAAPSVAGPSVTPGLVSSSHGPSPRPDHRAGTAASSEERSVPERPSEDRARNDPTAGRPILLPPNRAPLSAGLEASGTSEAVPAPMGVSDLGVGGSGEYEYGTTSFEGVLTLDSYGAFTPSNATNVSYPAPDWSVLQLDAVAVNVTLPPGLTNGTFWIQNGLHLNGTSAQLQDNVWNFTSPNPSLPSTTLEGKEGSILYGEVYSAIGPSFSITYPTTIALYDNISTVGTHTVVQFGYQIGTLGGTYDTVTFNGTASDSSPSEFLVNGFAPVYSVDGRSGPLSDAEFVLGGNGDGSNVDLTDVSGTATLERKVDSAYAAVPAAYDFGVDTSETSVGLAVAYSGTTAQLTPGPSFAVGLWGTAGAEASPIAPPAASGWITVEVDVSPSYAFLFANYSHDTSNYSFAPTTESGELVTELPPNATGKPYVFDAWADGWTNASTLPVSASTGSPIQLSLASNPTAAPDAPVYLRGATQVTAFTTAAGGDKIPGAGYSPSTNTLWLNRSKDALAPPFRRLNGFDYPVFTLVAALRANVSIVVNGFVQAPSTYNYTGSGGPPNPIANWTQGYFFYYGDGHDTVENTTIEGYTPLVYTAYPTYPPSTVEFYHTSDPSVANLTVASDAIGVTAIGSTSVHVANLSVSSGALGLEAVDAHGLDLVHASASGQDRDFTASTLAVLVATPAVAATDLSISDDAYGIDADGVADLTLANLTVTSNAWGLLVNASSPGTLTNLSVGSGLESAAGIWSNSTGLTLQAIDVNGTGLNLSNDSSVSLADGAAVGFASDVVDSFYNSSEGTFRAVTANAGAEGLDLEGGTNVNASDVSASNGSIGVAFSDETGASGTGFTSTNLSVGAIVNGTHGGTFTHFTASDQSVGADVVGSTGITVGAVTASNETLGDAYYIVSTTIVPILPIAGVVLSNDTSPTVSVVSVANYPFGVWSNNSTDLGLTEVVATYGFEAVALNFTNASKVTEVFAFSDYVGVDEENSTGTTLATSTIELSGGVGLDLTNASKSTVQSNNFIGNNGSSVSGGYDASHPQAIAVNTTGASFKGNYWADRSGSSYTIFPGNATAPAVKDATPISAFFSTYLEFHEKGLPGGWSWTVVLAPGTNWTTNVSVLYLPGWTLANGNLAFTVEPVAGYPAHPASGNLVWDAASLSESIVFGTPGTPGLSPYVWLAIAGAGAGAAVVAFLLWRNQPKRRRARQQAAVARKAEWKPDDPR